MRKLTTEKFIEKAMGVHGGKYDYSMVTYESSGTKVIIICREHGEFFQTPAAHCCGQGCPQCGILQKSKSKLLGRDKFISKAKSVHGDKYDYPQIEYISIREKVKIICRKHGMYKQTPDSHLSGRGCPECAKSSIANALSLDQDVFISRAKLVHNDKYDYSETEYVSAHKKIKIICPQHGIFTQNANDHINGCGCPKCGKLRMAKVRSLSQDDFIIRSKAAHGDKYDYSKTKYIRSHDKLKIICPIHGEFEQIAQAHMSGQGCEKCGRQAVGDINGRNSMGWRATEWEQSARTSKEFDGFKLYLVLMKGPINGEYFVKVGRTFRSIDRRLKHTKLDFKIIDIYTSSALDVFKAEIYIKKAFKEQRVIPSVKFCGMHECFSITALDGLMTEFENLNRQSHNSIMLRK